MRLTFKDLVWATVVILASVSAAAIATGNTLLGMAPLAAIVVYGMVTRSWARMIFVVAGGMVVLQSETTAGKIVYVAGAALCYAMAVNRVPQFLKIRPELAIFRPVLYSTTGIYAVVIISFFTSVAGGVGSLDWFRAVIPYILLAALPIVGLDVAIDASVTVIRRWIVIFGIIAPLAVMTDWLDRRGVSALPIGRFALGSAPLCAMLVGYSLARLAGGPNRIRWFAAAVWAPLALTLTGTRSGLALLGGIFGAIGSSKKARIPTVPALAGLAGLGLSIYFLIPIIGGRLVADPDFYSRRFASLKTVFNSSADLTADQSFLARAYQTETASTLFEEHVFFGAGIGKDYAGVSSFDTPIAPLAFFGLVGGVLLLAYVAAFYRVAVNMRKQFGYSMELTAFRSFFAVLICLIPLGSVWSDKGLALTLFLFIALLAASARDRGEAGTLTASSATPLGEARRPEAVPHP